MTVACRLRVPFLRLFVFHATEYTPPGPSLSTPIRWLPSVNVTSLIFSVAPATTTSRSLLNAQTRAGGSTQVTVGPFTTVSFDWRNAVLG